VESSGGGFGGRGAPSGGPIEDGKVEGANISFRTGTAIYTGTIDGDRIELHQTGGAGGRGGRGGGAPAAAETGPRPAIGPPPQGSDQSFGAGRGGAQTPAPIVLRRAKR
jgi:beta-galactosidase